MKVFGDNPGFRATFNFNGALLKLLSEKGYGDVIVSLKALVERGQIELTGSAAYHPFLPLIPREEKLRQIRLNDEISRKFLGKVYSPCGFFSPELAFDYETAGIVQGMGYKWMVLPELAYGPQPAWPDKIFVLKGSPDFKVFFRHKRGSVILLSSLVRTVETLKEELEDILDKNIYVLSIMDAETFGHHRPGMEDFLEEVYRANVFRTITVSEIENYFESREEVNPRESTWSNEEQDFWLDKEKGVVSKHPFLLWQDPSNPIHKLQWEFTYWVIDLVKEKAPGENEICSGLDRALGSDQYWWASAKPWWSLEMIEAGAFRLREIVKNIPGVSEAELKKARRYYLNILEYAFDWQRSGKIRKAHREAEGWKKIPFKERAPAGWYNQVILEFEDEMKKAAEKLEFEKAIKWRDAIIKLKKGTDIYDVLHVVDELHAVRKIPSLKSVAEHKAGEISEFARKHFVDEETK